MMERGRRTHVFLANVHALAADLGSHVDAVIDEERDAVALGDGVDGASGANGVVAGARFIAVLHDGCAAADR